VKPTQGDQQVARPRQHSYEQTLERSRYLAPVLAFLIIILAAGHGNGQSKPPALHSGQSVYIVAFRINPYPIVLDGAQGDPQRENVNYELGAEREVRKRIEEWGSFKVVEKLSDADFVFLVHLEFNSVEGLAIPVEAYHRHFKEKFDLDALRDAAFGRYLVGPLKLPTLGRLTDRLVKQFREKLTKP
jgi:hypothetical protein